MSAAGPDVEPGVAPGRDLADCIMAVARLQDRDAFAVLFGHFAPRLKTYFIRHGASVATAEDLAQESLLSVWRKAAFYDPAKAGAAAWVFTIARNLRIDALRRERNPAALKELPDTPSQSLSDGDDQTARTEWEALIAQALAQLPAEQAEVIHLTYFEGRSHSEIERRLGLPLGTVKSRLRAAMRRLRQALDSKL